jgi:Cdc6-like AAA superfamily ATPase
MWRNAISTSTPLSLYISGAVGTGKTALLQQIAKEFENESVCE